VAYDPTIYLGSAAHYRSGRPAYSPEPESVLTQKAGLDGTGRLLDAGCGPGVLTVRLAPLFAQAVGLDPDAGMLAEGRRAAAEKSVMNTRWVQGLAEDLPAAAPGPYRLVTFGQSFYWTDEQHVAETVYDMLEPGGGLALIVHTVTGRPRPPDPGVPAIPHDEIKARNVAGSLQAWRRDQGLYRPLARTCAAVAAACLGLAAVRPAPLFLSVALVVLLSIPWVLAVVRHLANGTK
jgi:SAM-dependent methyltransferase